MKKPLMATALSPSIGSVIEGVDLALPLDDEDRSAVRSLLFDRKVVFFRDQQLSSAQFRDFARLFGDPEVLDSSLQKRMRPGVSFDPVCREVMRFEYGRDVVARENFWHFDLASTMQPSAGTVLLAREVPEVGGDTLFADMAAAYERLDDQLKETLDALVGLHDFVPQRRALRARGAGAEHLAAWDDSFPLVEFPVVRTHPVTGRRTLFVTETYTVGFRGMDASESTSVLRQLCRQAWLPEIQCRFRWRDGSLALWDNLGCQHYAACDYWPATRVMERMTLLSFAP